MAYVHDFSPRLSPRLLTNSAKYVVTILLWLAAASGLMLARRSFGGSPTIQVAVGAFAILVLGSMTIAIQHVRSRRIEQHRAWMLRMGSYCGAVITMRIFTFVGAQIFARAGTYYEVFSCDELASIVSPQRIHDAYSQCVAPGATKLDPVPVLASFGKDADLATVASALRASFGMAVSDFPFCESHNCNR